jgi:hypothetical protein
MRNKQTREVDILARPVCTNHAAQLDKGTPPLIKRLPVPFAAIISCFPAAIERGYSRARNTGSVIRRMKNAPERSMARPHIAHGLLETALPADWRLGHD